MRVRLGCHTVQDPQKDRASFGRSCRASFVFAHLLAELEVVEGHPHIASWPTRLARKAWEQSTSLIAHQVDSVTLVAFAGTLDCMLLSKHRLNFPMPSLTIDTHELSVEAVSFLVAFQHVSIELHVAFVSTASTGVVRCVTR